MEQMSLGEFEETTKLALLSKEELIRNYSNLEVEYFAALKEIYRLKSQALTDDQLRLIAREKLAELNAEKYGASSEKYQKSQKPNKEEKAEKAPNVKKPSQRYPKLPVRKVEVALETPPGCTLCGQQTQDSGLREISEQLTVIPKKYEIVETARVIYRCACCHGSLQTAALPKRIIEGSSYSDEMIMDVALSKYCDLIPIQRYVAMATRQGVKNIPAHSLIGCTHDLADFGISLYQGIEQEVMADKVMRADETPHRMLEGSENKSWYLWSFSSQTAAFFECHDTRSGSVASNVLKYATCSVLLTDRYSGYDSATAQANLFRQAKGMPLIANAYCNAHARRYFFKSWPAYPEAEWYLEQYAQIYKLNANAKGRPPDEVQKARLEMKPLFEVMRQRASLDTMAFSDKSKIAQALNYFLGNYNGLTLFLGNHLVPIDNNSQEALLRNPVVGRKTWYGTHSERGARTAAIFYTIVESCKLNKVNPREYLPIQVENIKNKLPIQTPSKFKLIQSH